MHILVTNDDGIDACGLRRLVAYLGRFHQVTVCAPLHQNSGASHSATYYKKEITVHRRYVEGAQAAYAVEGTPVDCVYAALKGLDIGSVDLLISGINHGLNTSSDTHYSGTIGAAYEGLFHGIPSIATSIGNWHPTEETDFSDAVEVIGKIAEKWVARDDREDILLNVNIPFVDKGSIKGIKVTSCRVETMYAHQPLLLHQEGDEMVYSFKNEYLGFDAIGSEDIRYVQEGYVTLTPLRVNWSDEQMIEKLKGELE